MYIDEAPVDEKVFLPLKEKKISAKHTCYSLCYSRHYKLVEFSCFKSLDLLSHKASMRSVKIILISVSINIAFGAPFFGGTRERIKGPQGFPFPEYETS